MIDISIKMPPAPTPPNKSNVDPVTSIPRSHRVDEMESDREQEQPQKRKQQQSQEPDDSPASPASEEEDRDEKHPHIDNYA